MERHRAARRGCRHQRLERLEVLRRTDVEDVAPVCRLEESPHRLSAAASPSDASHSRPLGPRLLHHASEPRLWGEAWPARFSHPASHAPPPGCLKGTLNLPVRRFHSRTGRLYHTSKREKSTSSYL